MTPATAAALLALYEAHRDVAMVRAQDDPGHRYAARAYAECAERLRQAMAQDDNSTAPRTDLRGLAEREAQ